MSSIVTSIKREQSIVRPMLLVDKGQPVDAANDLAVSGSSFAFVVVLTLAAFMFWKHRRTAAKSTCNIPSFSTLSYLSDKRVLLLYD